MKTEAWFIEHEVDEDGVDKPGSGLWTRYTGAFDDAKRAMSYMSYYRDLYPRSYRIRRYVPGDEILTAKDIIK